VKDFYCDFSVEIQLDLKAITFLFVIGNWCIGSLKFLFCANELLQKCLIFGRMSGVDAILSYKKNPDEDFYALLNCDENSSVRTQTKFQEFSRANDWEFPSSTYRKTCRNHKIALCLVETRFAWPRNE
jgi:hypothetical protein